MKELIANIICKFCKVFKIHLMVNIRLEAKDAKLIKLTEYGVIRYCEFCGHTVIDTDNRSK